MKEFCVLAGGCWQCRYTQLKLKPAASADSKKELLIPAHLPNSHARAISPNSLENGTHVAVGGSCASSSHTSHDDVFPLASSSCTQCSPSHTLQAASAHIIVTSWSVSTCFVLCCGVLSQVWPWEQ
jgi:hypothetical protein